ncbi:HAD-IA family hydrolase [Mannheimia massilioguelmaensis]|uniref:HAD-IA family hydrolase n=1 Tax=Mannheimia massilioguelmaensis TaxID=1604354 RepID=UPI0005C9C283|nr:HAD-IA family hydrolase [Mannheimia massilioguelmaensis]
MKYYRTLYPFKVISFDLDDTLYDNSQVILDAEQRCVDVLHELSGIAELNRDYWNQWKERIAKRFPLLMENVTEWRIQTINELLTHHKKSAVEIEKISNIAMKNFFEWRHKMQVPQANLEALNQLKNYYKLAAITNGNVTPQRAGLNQFDLVLTGGVHGRAKPHQDLFHQAADYFKVQPNEILHVGDNLITDVQGAIQAGCQAAWINLSNQSLNQLAEANLCPTLEIFAITDLLNLIHQ